MSDRLDTLQQQFAAKSAEITSGIFTLERKKGDDHEAQHARIERLFTETKEILEQLEAEVRNLPPPERSVHLNLVSSFKKELQKLRNDYKQAKIRPQNGSEPADQIRIDVLDDQGDDCTLLDVNAIKAASSGQSQEPLGAKILTQLAGARPKGAGSRSTGHSRTSGSGRLAALILRKMKQSKLLVYIAFFAVLIIVFMLFYGRYNRTE